MPPTAPGDSQRGSASGQKKDPKKSDPGGKKEDAGDLLSGTDVLMQGLSAQPRSDVDTSLPGTPAPGSMHGSAAGGAAGGPPWAQGSLDNAASLGSVPSTAAPPGSAAPAGPSRFGPAAGGEGGGPPWAQAGAGQAEMLTLDDMDAAGAPGGGMGVAMNPATMEIPEMPEDWMPEEDVGELTYDERKLMWEERQRAALSQQTAWWEEQERARLEAERKWREDNEALLRAALLGDARRVKELLRNGAASPAFKATVREVLEDHDPDKYQELSSGMSDATPQDLVLTEINALQAAAWQKHPQVVKQIADLKRMNSNAKIQIPDPVEPEDAEGKRFSVFHYFMFDIDQSMARLDEFDKAKATLRMLCKYFGGKDGANLCATDSAGVSPVHQFFDFITDFNEAGEQKTAMVEALIKAGCHKEAWGLAPPGGDSPMMRLIQCAPEIAMDIAGEYMRDADRKACMEHAKDPNFMQRLLIRRAGLGDVERVKVLMKMGANPNWHSGDGRTALFLAARQRKYGVVSQLGHMRNAGSGKMTYDSDSDEDDLELENIVPPDPLAPNEASKGIFHFIMDGIGEVNQSTLDDLFETLDAAEEFFGSVRHPEQTWYDDPKAPKTLAVNVKDKDGLTAGHYVLRAWKRSLVDSNIALRVLEKLVSLGADLSIPASDSAAGLGAVLDMGPSTFKNLILDRMISRKQATPVDMLAHRAKGQNTQCWKLYYGWNTAKVEVPITLKPGVTGDRKPFDQNEELLEIIYNNPEAHSLLKHPVVRQQTAALWQGGYKREVLKGTISIAIFVLLLTVAQVFSAYVGPFYYSGSAGIARVIIEAIVFTVNAYFLYQEFKEFNEARHTIVERRRMQAIKAILPALDMVWRRLNVNGFVAKTDITVKLAKELGVRKMKKDDLDKKFWKWHAISAEQEQSDDALTLEQRLMQKPTKEMLAKRRRKIMPTSTFISRSAAQSFAASEAPGKANAGASTFKTDYGESNVERPTEAGGKSVIEDEQASGSVRPDFSEHKAQTTMSQPGISEMGGKANEIGRFGPDDDVLVDRSTFYQLWMEILTTRTDVRILQNPIIAHFRSVFNLLDALLHICVTVLYTYRLGHYLGDHSGHDIHFDEQDNVDMFFSAMAGVLAWAKLARFFLAFQPMGPLIVMVFTMLKKDISRYIAILGMFFFGFATAFFVVLKDVPAAEGNFNNYPKAAVWTFFMMLDGVGGTGVLGPLLETAPIIGVGIAVVFSIMCQILLINLLIAMMATSYSVVWEKAETEYAKQVVKAILDIYESNRASGVDAMLNSAMALATTGSASKGIKVDMDGAQTSIIYKHQFDLLDEEATPIEQVSDQVSTLEDEVRTISRVVKKITEQMKGTVDEAVGREVKGIKTQQKALQDVLKAVAKRMEITDEEMAGTAVVESGGKKADDAAGNDDDDEEEPPKSPKKKGKGRAKFADSAPTASVKGRKGGSRGGKRAKGSSREEDD
ncbi:unnamed protein product [Pedinophyceae sp. YPF-701]|nr:unnamed protein product [Pedinophyceae sp. YPF-701]